MNDENDLTKYYPIDASHQSAHIVSKDSNRIDLYKETHQPDLVDVSRQEFIKRGFDGGASRVIDQFF